MENALPVARTEMSAQAHSSVPVTDKPDLHYKFLLTYAKIFLLGSANGQLEGPYFFFFSLFLFHFLGVYFLGRSIIIFGVYFVGR